MSILKSLMPFANDIANSLTVSGIPGFENIYKACPESTEQLLIKTSIDVIALIGIIWSICLITSNKGLNAGLAYGIMVIIVAFVIPNIFMDKFVDLICGEVDEPTGGSPRVLGCILTCPKKIKHSQELWKRYQEEVRKLKMICKTQRRMIEKYKDMETQKNTRNSVFQEVK